MPAEVTLGGRWGRERHVHFLLTDRPSEPVANDREENDHGQCA